MAKSSEGGEAAPFSLWGYFMIAYPFFISLGFGGSIVYTLGLIAKYFIDWARSKMYCEIRIESED